MWDEYGRNVIASCRRFSARRVAYTLSGTDGQEGKEDIWVPWLKHALKESTAGVPRKWASLTWCVYVPDLSHEPVGAARPGPNRRRWGALSLAWFSLDDNEEEQVCSKIWIPDRIRNDVSDERIQAVLSTRPTAGMKSFFRESTPGRRQVPSLTSTLKAFSTIHVSPFSRTRSCVAWSGFVTSIAVMS